jgi:DNA-binding Xre family transcriptional regulator
MIRLRISEVAKEKGISMRKLAKEAGIAYNTLRLIYRNPHRDISLYTLDSIARVLGVPPGDLIESVAYEELPLRDAVNKPGLKEKALFHPVLDAFVRALPHTYRNIPVTASTVIKFVVTGEAGDTWYLVGADNRWSLYTTVELLPTTTVTMDQETCWRLFTKGITREQAFSRTNIAGEQALGQHLLSTVSIIA